jgi:carboxymethylenebutenolidase
VRSLFLLFAVFAGPLTVAAAQGSASPGHPWWWDDAFWQEGRIAVPTNHPVDTRWINYRSGTIEIPALVARPKDGRKYPGVLYMHGRRGLDELIQLQVKRLAARGLVVLAPDVYQAHFIAPMPIEHDYRLEEDADRGIDALLSLPDLASRRICLASHTRGGYFTLKMAVTKKRQEMQVACYVSWYPHWQDPNAPEALQVYSYAKEANELKIPTLVFVGEQEQYQRRRGIEEAVKNMERLGRSVRLVLYPGVGRGFDFRPADVRTFADDLASKDSLARAAEFIRWHLRD